MEGVLEDIALKRSRVCGGGVISIFGVTHNEGEVAGESRSLEGIWADLLTVRIKMVR